MIGRRVKLTLKDPMEWPKGELRAKDEHGVTVYVDTGMMDTSRLVFYPMHRLVQMEDDGEVYR